MTDPLPDNTLPEGLSFIRCTASFTAETVPAGLLKDHSTKGNTWGLIKVEAGELTYRIAATGESRRIHSGDQTVIEPALLHSVSLSPDCIFHVEFWR